MKMMIWIDDATYRLKKLSSSLFPNLWEHDVCNRIILAGNNYKTMQPGAKREDFVDALCDDIADLFYQFCYERKGNTKLDNYYKTKENIIPIKPKDLLDNPSGDKVVETIYDLAQNSKNGDIVVGIDIMLNDTESEKLTDGILKKLSGSSNIKIFIYSFSEPEEYHVVKKFIEEHNEVPFLRGYNLVIEGSKEYKDFFKYFDIEI
jgi:hypothetical protein